MQTPEWADQDQTYLLSAVSRKATSSRLRCICSDLVRCFLGADKTLAYSSIGNHWLSSYMKVSDDFWGGWHSDWCIAACRLRNRLMALSNQESSLMRL